MKAMIDNKDMCMYNVGTMKKTEFLTIRMPKKERDSLRELAKEEGHVSVTGFVKWLINNYKSGKLRIKR